MSDWYGIALAIAINYSQIMLLLRYLWILKEAAAWLDNE